jgi:hypothetical protein
MPMELSIEDRGNAFDDRMATSPPLGILLLSVQSPMVVREIVGKFQLTYLLRHQGVL